MREGVGKVACAIFFYFFVGERRFEKTPNDLTKKRKNCTTTYRRPTALQRQMQGKCRHAL
ncbi:MAG: hypothetical protein ACOVQ2_07905 [Flavobacterium sp.]